MGAVKGNGTHNNHGAPGSSGVSRVLKGVFVIIFVVFIFCYVTRMFTGSRTVAKNEEAQPWRVDTVVNSHRHTRPQKTGRKRNKTDALTQSVNKEMDTQNVTRDARPSTDDISGPVPTVTLSISSSSSSITDGGNNDKIQTVLSTLQLSYMDIKLGEDNGIPTVQFLDVSEALKPLLDAVGSSVSLIEQDIGGNAEKLRRCYEEMPSQCQTVQDMVTYDIKMGRAKDKKRSVSSLMWFKRAFEFIKRLMIYIANGATPSEAANAAYDEVLSKHHGFLIRATFMIAMKLLPSRETFLRNLIIDKADLARPGWEDQLTADIKQYCVGMESILSILRDFYTEYNLEN